MSQSRFVTCPVCQTRAEPIAGRWRCLNADCEVASFRFCVEFPPCPESGDESPKTASGSAGSEENSPGATG